MRGSRYILRVGIATMSAATLFSSCSLKVKVKEEWNDSHKAPIPLGDASRTWSEIRYGGVPSEAALQTYNAAVRGTVVQIAENWTSDKSRLSKIRTVGGDVDILVNSLNVSDLHLVEEIIPADFVKVRQGLKSESEVKGLGTSLLVRQPWSETDRMIPKTGLWYPVTAILNLDRPESPVLELIDPTRQGRFAGAGRELPLSANYSAALARDFQDRQLQFESLSSLIRFEKYADRIGLYRVSAFDPAKKPCILIHGIYSSPSTWDEVLNRLYAVEEIRERYEFWTFGYPTGAPIPFMASMFRESILDMIEFRRRRGASEEKITLVGHSMGGLLSKAVTQSGGDEDWDKLFNVPIEELKVSESDRDVLRRMLYYEPISQVDRVVFCATPHRGSKIAENPGAKLVGELIQVPSQLAKVFGDVISQSAYALTPLGMEFTRDRITSIDQLSSSARTTADFLQKPLNHTVTYHSIIGNNGGPGKPLEKVSDNIVAYESAHISGVASEAVIPRSNHGVHRTEGGIQEIIRILNLP